MERKHRLRAVRNLIAAVLLLTVFWWLYGCPLPTSEMRFRRSARQFLLVEQSDIVFSCESEGEAIIGDPVMLVGVAERTIHTCSRTHPFNVWPQNPAGATLVVLPSELEYKAGLVVGLVAVEPPALAERAMLVMYLNCDGREAVVTSEGERKEAVFLFRIEETEDVPYAMLDTLFHTTDLPPYTLEFFGGDGTLLETVTNIA